MPVLQRAPAAAVSLLEHARALLAELRGHDCPCRSCAAQRQHAAAAEHGAGLAALFMPGHNERLVNPLSDLDEIRARRGA